MAETRICAECGFVTLISIGPECMRCGSEDVIYEHEFSHLLGENDELPSVEKLDKWRSEGLL